MVQMYTIDGAMLTEVPKIILGDKLYPVDNRTKNIKAMAKLKAEDGGKDVDEQMLELLLGKKAAKEIEDMNLPWPAYQRLLELVTAAATGEEPDEARFREAKEAARQQ